MDPRPPLGRRGFKINWSKIFSVVLAVLLVVVLIGLVMNWDEKDDGKSETVDPTPEPTASALRHNYQEMQLLRISEAPGSLDFCVTNPDYIVGVGLEDQSGTGKYVEWRPMVFAFKGDGVEIGGPAKYFSEDGWQWPVVGRRGSKYMVGEYGWISDNSQSYPIDDIPPLREPSFEVGERVLLAYNFTLRSSPNGEALLGSLGIPLVMLGGSKIEILEGPVLGDDESYWCKVLYLDYKTEEPDTTYFPIAWVPCEFQRYEH